MVCVKGKVLIMGKFDVVCWQDLSVGIWEGLKCRTEGVF